MRFSVSVDAAAPREQVFELLTHWERQPEWMLDAKAVEVLTPQREGVGVTIRCPTNLMGVTVEDVMRVTAYERPRVLEVVHLGRIITGSGRFELAELDGTRCRITWVEEVDPPLGAFGEWGASTFVQPVLKVVFRRSLRGLARLAEDEFSRGGPSGRPAAS